MSDFDSDLRFMIVEVEDASSQLEKSKHGVAEWERILARKKDELFRIVNQERKRLIASAEQPDTAAKQEGDQ